MKRLVLDQPEGLKRNISPRDEGRELTSLRSKIAHNHPLEPSEIAKIGKLLGQDKDAEKITARLEKQRLDGRNYALTLEERERVDAAILQVIEMTRANTAQAMSA